jgi:hypothetical protein
MQRLMATVLLAGCAVLAMAQAPMRAVTTADSDGDGVSDALESSLLERFRPTVMVGEADCSTLPAQFLPNTSTPYVLADDGTIYGQAFEGKAFDGGIGGVRTVGVTQQGQAGEREIELHYYILWRADCGRMGHALDAEHISALVRGESDDAERWRAVYWYAAAHEDTVCDASQLTRASTIGAVTHGVRVWSSNGKHGSFLNEELCQHGCGGDRCEKMHAVASTKVINVGEADAVMNGAQWTSSPRWPLKEKMLRTDFTAVRVTRLEGLPETDVAWAEPAKRPAQAAIRGGNAGIDGALLGLNVGGSSTADALSLSNRNTNTALVLANAKTERALGTSAHSTGSALTKSYRSVRGALGSAVKHTGEAMGVEGR